MTNKITFVKNYTRDTSLFLQDLWAIDQSVLLPRLLGKENPHLPGIIHYATERGVEIWENEEATQWLLDVVLEKNITDSAFFEKEMEKHSRVVEEMKKLWNKKVLTSVEELKSLTELVIEGVTGFNIFYRTAFDDRTPVALRAQALEMRKNDLFFSQNDQLIHTSLSAIFPELKGYENYVFSNELDSLPSIKILSTRKQHFVVIDGSEKFLGTLDAYAKDHSFYTFLKDELIETKELRGQIGFKGKVQGTVKLLFKREQMAKINTGDILVSPMTTPDFLPAMEKAAAFITDEGGITCHAAIVAREMKKPCIIGTKIATQVLKDGDMVEVDAEKGIVTILK